jgi:hypothetical protein
MVNSLPYRATSLIGVVVYTIKGRSLAGILTPTVKEFWRAYIEKTREATSPAAAPYIEASYDYYTYPYINPHQPTPTPY